MLAPEILKHFLNFLVELFDPALPVKVEQIHLCQMCLLQLPQFLLVFDLILIHLPVLQLLLQSLCLPLEGLGFDILPLGLALLLPADGVLSSLRCMRTWRRRVG